MGLEPATEINWIALNYMTEINYVQVAYNQCSQKSALNVSLILANADDKMTSRVLVQVLLTVTHKKCRQFYKM